MFVMIDAFLHAKMAFGRFPTKPDPKRFCRCRGFTHVELYILFTDPDV